MITQQFNPEDSDLVPVLKPKYKLTKAQRIIDVSEGISFTDRDVFTPNDTGSL
jgi:hypothetical protein